MISRYFLSGKGATIYFPADEHSANEQQCAILEPEGQILCHFENEDQVNSKECWEKIRSVNSVKPKRGFTRYFDYKKKIFVFRKKITFKNNNNKAKDMARNLATGRGGGRGGRGGKGSGGRGTRGGGRGRGRGGRF